MTNPNLPTFTLADVRALKPCYDPVTGLSPSGKPAYDGGFVTENWTGNALDVLRMTEVPAKDRFWLVSREEWIDARILRQFALWMTGRYLEQSGQDFPDLRQLLQYAEQLPPSQVKPASPEDFQLQHLFTEALKHIRHTAIISGDPVLAWIVVSQAVENSPSYAAWKTAKAYLGLLENDVPAWLKAWDEIMDWLIEKLETEVSS